MKAITYPALGKVQAADIDEPVPAAGEVAVYVHASGICHTGIDIVHGRYGYSTFPIVPVHEYAGNIVALGKDAGGILVGGMPHGLAAQ